MLYGGDIKLYNMLYDNETEGNITKEGVIFLKELQKEIESLILLIWTKYPHLHDLKTGINK